MNDAEFKRRKPIPEILRSLNPSYSKCEICGLPWSHCEPHTVIKYNKIKGTFATCQYCWERATLEQVIEAHKKAYEKQEAQCRRPHEDMKVSWKVMKKYVEFDYTKSHGIYPKESEIIVFTEKIEKRSKDIEEELCILNRIAQVLSLNIADYYVTTEFKNVTTKINLLKGELNMANWIIGGFKNG